MFEKKIDAREGGLLSLFLRRQEAMVYSSHRDRPKAVSKHTQLPHH
jgi:hypothetical protein